MPAPTPTTITTTTTTNSTIPNSPNSPPTPTYIFRAHTAAIHALHFFQHNALFASGDSTGYIVIWRLSTRRPIAAWRAHEGGVMGIRDWSPIADYGARSRARDVAKDGGSGVEERRRGVVRLITHGRDHKLRVWELVVDDGEGGVGLMGRLPVDVDADAGGGGKTMTGDEGWKPWLVFSMDVNALNFCAFGMVVERDRRISVEREGQDNGSTCGREAQGEIEGEVVGNGYPPLLLAMPNGLDNGCVDIFQLPSERRVSKVGSEKDGNTGMVMCLRLFYGSSTGKLILVVGYEDGQVAVFARKEQNVMPVWIWERLMLVKVHTQPVLSLDVSPDRMWFVTSSADALLCKFRVLEEKMKGEGAVQAEKVTNTKHAGQQDLKIRNDGKVFATAGWDKNVRVYSGKSMKELGVLHWHREGCYALAFAEVGLATAKTNDEGTIASMSAMERFKYERDLKVHNTHWLVAGSKDGKISLWDVY